MVLGKGGHIFMNIICVVALWLVRVLPPETLTKSSTNDIEHGRGHNSRLTTGLRRSARWRAPLLNLGLARPLRPTTQRRDSRLAGGSNHQLHAPSLQCGLHVTRFRRGRAQRRSVRPDLSLAPPVHAQALPQGAVESGAPQQAVPGYWRALEWVGGCCAVLAL